MNLRRLHAICLAAIVVTALVVGAAQGLSPTVSLCVAAGAAVIYVVLALFRA